MSGGRGRRRRERLAGESGRASSFGDPRTLVTAKDPAFARIIAFYEGLPPGDLPRLREVYASNAYVRDPFDARMFEDLADIRFTLTLAILAKPVPPRLQGPGRGALRESCR